MKKLSIFFLALFMALMAKAQVDETFQFVDASGQPVPHGSVIKVTTTTDDGFGGIQMPIPMSVKNASDETAYVRVVYEISSIDNGAFQICFPVTCNQQHSVGTYETATGPMEGGQTKDLQSEWLPTAEGTCTVVLRLEPMLMTGQFPHQSFQKLCDGPQVTVLFDNSTINNISAVSNRRSMDLLQNYALDGRRLMTVRRGLNIIRMGDGSARKVVISKPQR